jgi:hypothetical protein
MTTLQYERGMRIIYDPNAKKATVCFRGRARRLEGVFMTGEDAKEAGEAYCRAVGWNPEFSPRYSRSLLAHRGAPLLPR